MYNVNISWDEEAKVWMATSGDIKGLVLEGECLDELKERVCLVATTELLPINNQEEGELINFIIK